MRPSTTLGALARREAVLASFLGAAAAVAALAEPLGAPWLFAVAAVIAATGATARVVNAVRGARLEGRVEQAGLDRRTRVQIESVTEIDPTQIGVEGAEQTILPGEKVPEYFPREVDGELRAAVRAALDGGEPWIVVAVGRSKVGKSRALFEALLYCAREAEVDLVAPVDGDALRSLLTPGAMPRIEHERSVLWLDDLEPFLNQGVTFQTLREWREGAPGRIVAGTLGGKGSDHVAGSVSGELETIAGEVLRNAHRIAIEATSSRELDPLRRRLSSAVLKAIEQHGLAAYLVAAQALEDKLVMRRHVGEPECPEGVAVVEAVIDWARCGRTDPIADETLRELWSSYLPAGTRPTDAGFEAGLQWALRPVAGTIALLEHTGSYRAYDYIVRFVHERADAQPPRDAAWVTAIDSARDAQALTVATIAYMHGRYDDAAAALRIARRSSTDGIAAVASNNLGVTLGKLDRPEEELAVYEEVVVRFGHAPEPALREQAAKALFNKGVALGALGRLEEELAVFGEVVVRFGDAPEPALREQAAKALFNKGVALGALDRPEEALAVFGEVVVRFGDAPEPALREQAAGALVNKGVALGALDRLEEELAVYGEVVVRFGDAPEPGLREQAAGALFNKGVALGALDRPEEALAVFGEVVVRFGDAPEPALREQAAKALFNKGVALDKLDRPEEAIAAYGEVVVRFGDAPEPALREQVAKALFNKGVALGALDRLEEELAVYGEVVVRFGDAPEPGLREQAAKALFNKGITLGALDCPEEALAVFGEVVVRFGDAPEPALREQVAKALFNKGVALGALDRLEEELAVYGEVVVRFGDAPEPALRDLVAKAQRVIAVLTGKADGETVDNEL